MLIKFERAGWTPKGWGGERLITNNQFYCGKVLEIKKGFKCSFHHHDVKREHFFLLKGSLLLRVSYGNDIEKAEEAVMEQGDVFEVPLGLNHQMEALEDCELFEFSTTDYSDDSIRIVKGD